MNQVFVCVEEGLKSPKWLDRIEVFALKVMEKLRLDCEELSILFCSDIFIRELNKTYRKIDSETDVLSFENGEKYIDDENREWIQLGDIAVSLDTLPKNAEYFEVSQNEELKRLIIHGILHLIGYDHGDEHIEKDKEPECEMLILQKKLISFFCEEILI